ncbi:MAG: DNA methylase [Oscillospiraceae bacterium]|nr:DNA methylase [Oscillospiraceae bacterium]
MLKNRVFSVCDLKSFYASVECMERGLDPMTTNLVVADTSRTEKTICLAVSPSLKAYGIPGRARLFEVIQRVKQVNMLRQQKAPGHRFTGASSNAIELEQNPSLALDYIIAPPQMARYIDFSTKICDVYFKHVAPEDVHVYSIDEVFMDITSYLKTSGMDARVFISEVIQDVFKSTGITAAAGIGTNLYLAKIAMDIVAKHVEPDQYGVRIAELDENSYRRLLWTHRPLTDFWRVGKGYVRKLEQHGIFTMGDIARCSVYHEDLLYDLFGVNAELLIDHAWGWEPCRISDIKAYKPSSNSICSGQVLRTPYDFQKTRLVIREMADMMALDLVEKKMVTDQLVLTIGYDIENLSNPEIRRSYSGTITTDHYGREVPKPAHGTANIGRQTSSAKLITEALLGLYDRIVNPKLLVRRLNLTAAHVVPEGSAAEASGTETFEQLDLFTDYEVKRKKQEADSAALERERRQQEAILNIRKKFGKNAILKGMSLEEGATSKERNGQIGGHKA